jgi:hypothetical protein
MPVHAHDRFELTNDFRLPTSETIVSMLLEGSAWLSRRQLPSSVALCLIDILRSREARGNEEIIAKRPPPNKSPSLREPKNNQCFKEANCKRLGGALNSAWVSRRCQAHLGNGHILGVFSHGHHIFGIWRLKPRA